MVSSTSKSSFQEAKPGFASQVENKIVIELNVPSLSPLFLVEDPFLTLEGGTLLGESTIAHLCCPSGSVGLVQQRSQLQK